FGTEVKNAKYMNVMLKWSNYNNNLNLKLFYYNGTDWSATRFSSEHNNSELREAIEKLTNIDIQEYVKNHIDIGIGIANYGNSEDYNLTINFMEFKPWENAKINSTSVINFELPAFQTINLNISINTSNLSEGNYEAYLILKNSSNVLQEFAIVPLYLYVEDNTPPLVTIRSPLNGSLYNYMPAINVSVRDTQSEIFKVISEINSSQNITLQKIGDYYVNSSILSFSEGQNYIRIYAYDSAENVNSTEVAYFTIDLTPPNISLLSPANNSNLSTSWVALKFKAIDNLANTMNCSLYINGILNQTESIANNTEGNFTIALSDGSYSWFILCKDTAKNEGYSEARVVNIDTVKPTITFVSPTPENNSNLSQNHVYINITLSEAPDTCLLEWNGTNETMQKQGYSCYINKTGLIDGAYTFKAYVNDSAGNLNVSDVRVVNIDTTPPTITIISPQNKTYNSTKITLNISANEKVNWWYNLNGQENKTFIPNTTIIALVGSNHLTVYANDSAGNIGLAKVSFTSYLESEVSVNTVGNQSIEITNASITPPVEIVLQTTQNVTGKVNITLTFNNSQLNVTPLNQTYGLRSNDYSLNKYLKLEESDNLNESSNNLSWTEIRIYYTIDDLDKNGDGDTNDAGVDVNENELSIYWYNESTGSWVKLGSNLNFVYSAGVNTSDITIGNINYLGYVYANLSHFSVYGLAGKLISLPPSPVITGGGGGGGAVEIITQSFTELTNELLKKIFKAKNLLYKNYLRVPKQALASLLT
ncbi:MAG: hypothetical protein DRN95_08505, partial [Candidatus Hydrothermarchaeota archaeon]